MGLIKAVQGAVGGVLADQWKEYFYCEALPVEVLMCKGVKRTSGRSSNTKASDNLISDGSMIAVNDGQFMIIVQQGEIVEFCGEPGEFVWDTSTEPSMFTGLTDGDLKTSVLDTAKTVLRRFTAGGDTMKDQRVYFFNTKEVYGNKYGTVNPVPYRVVDKNVGLDMDISIKCNGEYSYKIVDPLLFYKNVTGNDADEFTRDEIDSQLKAELLTALQPAFAKISAMGIRYSQLPAMTTELSDALKVELSKKWREMRGLEIASFGVNSVKAPEEDEERIKKLQMAGALKDPTMAAARLADAQAEAMVGAANNENAGGMMAFAGLNMANQAGGGTVAQMYNQAAQGQQQVTMGAVAAPAAAGWTCACGAADNTGKFCAQCGKPAPVKPEPWTCECGSTGNTGKFCAECGKPAPVKPEPWTCECGAAGNTGKFCAQCGKPAPAAPAAQ